MCTVNSKRTCRTCFHKWIRIYHVNLSQSNLGRLDWRPHHHGVPPQSFKKRHVQKHLPNVHQKAIRASKRPTSRKARSHVLETQDLSYLVCVFLYTNHLISLKWMLSRWLHETNVPKKNIQAVVVGPNRLQVLPVV